MDIKGNSANIRETLLGVEKIIRQLANSLKQEEHDLYDKGECIAQAMLSLRATEEARMRLGKVIQYAGIGVSCYDK